MNKIFQNEQLQEEFDQKGYVIVPSNLSEPQLDQLTRFYMDYSSPEEISKSLSFSLLSQDAQFKKEASSRIMESMKIIEEEVLDNYQLLIGSFAAKEPNRPPFGIHQNIPLIDEHQTTSLSLWMPLSDTSVENGSLQVITGSHHEYRRPRGYSNIFFNKEEILADRELSTLAVPRGHVVIFDNSLLHGSDVNHSANIRIAAVTQAIPAGATPIYYVIEEKFGKELVLCHEINQDFFLDIKKHLAAFPSRKPVDMYFSNQKGERVQLQ